jgi:hypothetical protein
MNVRETISKRVINSDKLIQTIETALAQAWIDSNITPPSPPREGKSYGPLAKPVVA